MTSVERTGQTDDEDVLVVEEDDDDNREDDETKRKGEDLGLIMTVDEIKSDEEGDVDISQRHVGASRTKGKAIAEVLIVDDDESSAKRLRKDAGPGTSSILESRNAAEAVKGEYKNKGGRPVKMPRGRPPKNGVMRDQYDKVKERAWAGVAKLGTPIGRQLRKSKRNTLGLLLDDEASQVSPNVDPPIIDFSPFGDDAPPLPPPSLPPPSLVKEVVDDYVDSNVTSLQKLIVVQSNYM